MAHIRRHPVDGSKWQVRYIDPAGRERSRIFRRKVDAEKFLSSGMVDAERFLRLVREIPESAYSMYPALSRQSVLDAVHDYLTESGTTLSTRA